MRSSGVDFKHNGRTFTMYLCIDRAAIGQVIHPDVQIGVNCLFFQQVTNGMRGGDGVP